MSDRKYRQHGYQDRGEKPQQKSGEKPVRKDTFGPRPLQMPGKRTVPHCEQRAADFGRASGEVSQVRVRIAFLQAVHVF